MIVRLAPTALACVAVTAVSAALFYNEFDAYSGDAGQHYAVIRAFMDTPWSKANATYLAHDLRIYPPVSHWLGAQIGLLTGSGFWGMSILAAASVSFFYFTMFVIASRIHRHAPLVACAITVAYALFRGPVFGRLVVNNYFYPQVVGSGLAALVFLLVLLKMRKWSNIALDAFVLVAVQILAATHLTPAAQLASSYCFVLLCVAIRQSDLRAVVRLMTFVFVCLLLTLINPYAAAFYELSQFNGGAHINLFGERLPQFALLAAGIWFSVRLITRASPGDDASLILGSVGLGACCFALLQILAFWFGHGSHYAIAKNMFFVMGVFIFVVSANLALARSADTQPARPIYSLLVCSLLAILTMRADLSPSVANLREVVKFQTAARQIAARLDAKDGRRPIVQSTLWPRNISFGITTGDMRLQMTLAEAILDDKPIRLDAVNLLLMPRKDVAVVPRCLTDYSNEQVAAMDYACFRRVMDASSAAMQK